jgi:hypothetical protein
MISDAIWRRSRDDISGALNILRGILSKKPQCLRAELLLIKWTMDEAPLEALKRTERLTTQVRNQRTLAKILDLKGSALFALMNAAQDEAKWDYAVQAVECSDQAVMFDDHPLFRWNRAEGLVHQDLLCRSGLGPAGGKREDYLGRAAEDISRVIRAGEEQDDLAQRLWPDFIKDMQWFPHDAKWAALRIRMNEVDAFLRNNTELIGKPGTQSVEFWKLVISGSIVIVILVLALILQGKGWEVPSGGSSPVPAVHHSGGYAGAAVRNYEGVRPPGSSYMMARLFMPDDLM